MTSLCQSHEIITWLQQTNFSVQRHRFLHSANKGVRSDYGRFMYFKVTNWRGQKSEKSEKGKRMA